MTKKSKKEEIAEELKKDFVPEDKCCAENEACSRENCSGFTPEDKITTKSRCLAEQITTYVFDTVSSQSVGYEYDYGSQDEKLTKVYLLTSEDALTYSTRGKSYTKDELKAHIVNLKEILKKFN